MGLLLNPHEQYIDKDLASEEYIFDLIRAELARAREKFPLWPCDVIHQAAVLGEEAGEVTRVALQVTYEPQKSSLSALFAELIQVGAMAVRMASSVHPEIVDEIVNA